MDKADLDDRILSIRRDGEGGGLFGGMPKQELWRIRRRWAEITLDSLFPADSPCMVSCRLDIRALDILEGRL